MNKKAQSISIIVFFVLMVGIFITSIIVLRVTNSILTPFQNQIGNISAPAGAVVGEIHNNLYRWWDIFVMLLFFINVILLFVSAFLIDIHPAFVLVYVISIFFLFIMGNYALNLLDSVWNGMATSTENAQTPIQRFIINHFMFIMLGIVILSGIIMYAKFKLGVGSGPPA